MSDKPPGCLFVDYNFRVFDKGIIFEDRFPENLSLKAMNKYGDYSVGDTFVLTTTMDGQLFLEKQ